MRTVIAKIDTKKTLIDNSQQVNGMQNIPKSLSLGENGLNALQKKFKFYRKVSYNQLNNKKYDDLIQNQSVLNK